ncbi:MAG TPA: hypothetical protein VKG44_02665, partial [Candidatus Baltobacteraceae bacterium]|nr:hypothetical protein [Candidatus Baltobacteraceae bacterium]
GECEVAERGHISAAEAGTLAREADVRRLVLTHYPMETNAAELFGEATRNFSGAITVADDLDRLDLN